MTSLSSRRKQAKPQRLNEDGEDDLLKGVTDPLSLFLAHTSPSSPPPMDLSTKRSLVPSSPLDTKSMQTMLFERGSTAQLLHQMLTSLHPSSILPPLPSGDDSHLPPLSSLLPSTPATSTSPPLTESRADSGPPTTASFNCAADACGKSFSSLGSLCWHIQDAHPHEPLFECEKCSGTYSRYQFSSHECAAEVPSPRPSSVAERSTVDDEDERRSVPATIRSDFRIIDGDEGMDFDEGKDESLSSREATAEPKMTLLSALFSKNDSSSTPMDLSGGSLPPHHLTPHPFGSMHHQSSQFMPRPPQEMMMTPNGRIPVDSILQNEDDWESLMEISNTDEAEKVRALVGDNPIPTTDPNQCILCRRVLSCKSALQMHYRTHTGERPFKCKICQRAFTTKGNLKTHMGVHRSKHPFRPAGMGGGGGQPMGGGGPMMGGGGLPQQQCPICQKRFVTVPQLQSHIAEHTQRLVPPTSTSSSSLPPFPTSTLPTSSPSAPPSLSSLPPFPFLPFLTPPSAAPGPGVMHNSQLHSFMQQLLAAQQKAVGGMAAAAAAKEELQSEMDDPSPLRDLHSFPIKTEEEAPTLDRQPTVTIESLLKAQQETGPGANSISPGASSDGSSGVHDQTDGSSISHASDTEEHRTGQIPSSSSSTGPTATATVSIRDELVRPLMEITDGEKRAENPLDAMKKMWAETEPPPPRPMPPLSKHQCAVCYKHFSSSSALQIHMRTHTGDKPFKCEVCGRAFTTRGNLKVHMSTHMTMHTPSRRGRRIFDPALEMGSPNGLPLPSPSGLQLPPHIAAQLQAMSGNLLPQPALPMQMLMQLMSSNLESLKPNCIICQKSFSSMGELGDHMKEHSVSALSAMANNNVDLKTES